MYKNPVSSKLFAEEAALSLISVLDTVVNKQSTEDALNSGHSPPFPWFTCLVLFHLMFLLLL